ncbi:hypothetical protein FNH05_31355 [Amycolatopsis rhizosphaerae]|uniref:Golvesin/Xly CBD-like domain-containing protein n=1 Tax=Amycolatopsis rhizosphaerae TaxID=2053003 RepID=A0A558AQF2_9PSEU|nr:RHS repeat-associated core domain-containing protein [Amycolatopsis rhizosphaerae]TVT26499.1 hypothetical protein FNH05_31355 [Amycolatopsis rhizosphaerae]
MYVQYPPVSGAATNAGYTIDHNGGSTTQTVDQTKNAGTWVSLGSYSFTQTGTEQKITLAQNGGGAVTADAIKVVRDNSGDTQPKPLSYSYSYDANGNLVDIADTSPGAQYDDYAYTYDGLNRMTQLQEKLSGTVKHTTGFAYDANGKPLTQTHDSAVATATYDIRNLLSTVVNKESSNDPNPKTTSYTYTPSMQIATETKGNNNVVTSTYNLDDSLTSTVEKNPAGTVVAQHTYTYDPNGNQTQDVSVTQNADNGSTSLNRTATNTYTPRDQIASVTNSDGKDNQNYTYDLAGNITAQTIAGVTSTNVFDRNRQLSTTQNGLTGTFNYDPFGRVDTVTSGSTVQDRYTYDGFDRVTSQQTFNGVGMSTTTNVYDAFSRKISQTTNAGTSNAKTTAFDFLATSNAVVGEEVGGTLTKTYQYSPWGERLDQIVHKTDGTEEATYYSYDAHTNVQAITDTSGNTKSTYGYTAYGSDDTGQATGVDKPGSQPAGTDPYNAYRFNADRVDTSSGTYDMGFRNYDPGTNRFLSRDSYEGALADLNMTADPYTGNRYAFGGGNPLSNIEMDGHEFVDANGAPRPGSQEFFDWMEQTLDDYVAQKQATGRAGEVTKGTYVMAYDPVTDRAVINMAHGAETVTNRYGDPCRNCAERVSAAELGVPVDQPYYSKARMIKSYQQSPKPFGPCTSCQVDMNPEQFPSNSDYQPGGRFDELKAAAAAEDASKAAGILGKLSTAFKWAGRGFAVLGIAADIYDVATAPDGQKVQTAVKDTSALGGALAGGELGAEWGAAIGTFIEPGGGTVVGGLIGGIAGGVVGAITGSHIGDLINDIGSTISSWF